MLCLKKFAYILVELICHYRIDSQSGETEATSAQYVGLLHEIFRSLLYAFFRLSQLSLFEIKIFSPAVKRLSTNEIILHLLVMVEQQNRLMAILMAESLIMSGFTMKPKSEYE